jgi:hypothetical protein
VFPDGKRPDTKPPPKRAAFHTASPAKTTDSPAPSNGDQAATGAARNSPLPTSVHDQTALPAVAASPATSVPADASTAERKRKLVLPSAEDELEEHSVKRFRVPPSAVPVPAGNGIRLHLATSKRS